MLAQRYDKTDKGREEIAQGRKNLRGKLRTVLFLVDGGKDVNAIQQQMAMIGAPADAISQLADQGYIVPLGATAPPAAAVSNDPVKRFRAAKAYMTETIVDARGIRAFAFTMRLERCATLQDLAALLPEFSEALQKVLDRELARAIVDRARELVR